MTADPPAERAGLMGKVIRTILSGLLLSSPLRAQAPTPGSELTISIMTMGVGAEVWERFGHNAIVVEDRRLGTRVSYNYGMFSFRQENFLLRFVQGRMLYWVDSMNTDWDVARYRAARRSVWLQRLNLTPAEREQLRDFLEWNVRGDNRFYRYDYYLDNCSTRVRDAIDRVLGGAFRRQTEGVTTGATFRTHTQRLNANNPLLYTGLLLAVGQGGDRQISAWDEMFLPLKLREHLRQVRVTDSAGQPVPLVAAETTVYESTAFPVPDRKPDWRPWYLMLGLVLGGFLAAAGVAGRGARWGRLTLGGLGGLWALLTGLGGIVLAGLWAFTDHTIASGNENLLQLTPIGLAILPALLGGLGGKPAWLGPASRLAAAAAALSVLGLLLKLLPAFYQANGEIIALTVPIHVGLLVGIRAWIRAPAA